MPPLELAFGGNAWCLRLVLEETRTLMGATRPRVGKDAMNVHTQNKGSQIALITRLSVSLCLNRLCGTRLLKKFPTRDASL